MKFRIKEEEPEKKLYPKNADVSLSGNAIIPDGTVEISDRVFDRNERLRRVTVPGTVKRIGVRAFADCPNLELVELEEGLEYIGGNAFTGCSSLHELVLPDSIRADMMDGWAFYKCTGLRSAVYNRSGTVLYAYPCTEQSKIFAVPNRVKRIGAAAFLENPYLEEVILHGGLERVWYRNFLNCGLCRITIPESVMVIESKAFWNCERLREVKIQGTKTRILDSAFYGAPADMKLLAERHFRPDEMAHLLGRQFLVPPNRQQLTIDGSHMKTKRFRDYAAGCAAGNTDAMWAMGAYFRELGEGSFYVRVSNFWRYRAYQRGSQEAKVWREQWFLENPGATQMESVMKESLLGNYSGRFLNACGFLFFEPERSYTIHNVEAREHYSIVEVFSWCDEDGPDEDGFGREEYYDWWYLDGSLREIKGVGMLHRYSVRDRTYNDKKFQEMRDRAVAALADTFGVVLGYASRKRPGGRRLGRV